MDDVIREAVKGFIKTGQAFDKSLTGQAAKHYSYMAPYMIMKIMMEEVVASQKTPEPKKKK